MFSRLGNHQPLISSHSRIRQKQQTGPSQRQICWRSQEVWSTPPGNEASPNLLSLCGELEAPGSPAGRHVRLSLLCPNSGPFGH